MHVGWPGGRGLPSAGTYRNRVFGNSRTERLSGVRVPAGEQICVVVPSANRDPAVYSQPNRLDLDRDAPANLSLATGPHLCAGAALARLEAHVAVARFVDRLADAKLAPPGPSYRTEGRPSLRGLAVLPITV